VTERLAGVLARFRRVRVELSALSLSATVCAGQGQRCAADKLAACLTLLRFDSLQSMHLNLQLGFSCAGVDESVEAQETVETQETVATLQSCAQALSPRRGLRIKFFHHVSPATPVIPEADVQSLFANIKRQCRIKGVTFALEDSFSILFATLIRRDAFSSVAKMEAFVESSQTRSDNPSEREDIWAPYKEIFARVCADDRTDKNTTDTDIHSTANSAVQSAPAVNADTENVSSASSSQSSAFGRRKKRMAVATVATPTKTRLRFTWSVAGPARYLSHLDNIRAIEAALLRSGLALSYT